MSERHVAVTGAAGFIGRWVVSELLDRGDRVTGFDNLSKGSLQNLTAFDEDDFSFVEGDVRDEDAVESVITAEVDACLHLAAEGDVQESLDNPNSHVNTNVGGTHNVLEACRKTNTRLGFVGTCMVYEEGSSTERIDESHPVEPASPYAGSKLAAEKLAESYHHGYGLPITLLRPFNTYGPFQRTGQTGGVVSIFMERDLHGDQLEIYGEGTQTRDLLYVTDCARFLVDALWSDDAVGEVINAGTGEDVTINELAEMIASEETSITHVEHHHPQSEIQQLRCDPTKAQTLLGWHPTISLQDGIERLRGWMKTRREGAQ